MKDHTHHHWLKFGVPLVLVVVLGTTVPGILDALQQRKALDEVFRKYADALISDDYRKAYQYTGDEFQAEVDLDSFSRQHRDLEASLGNLLRIDSVASFAKGEGRPSKWVGIVSAELVFEKIRIRVTYEFHRQEQAWRLFGVRQEN